MRGIGGRLSPVIRAYVEFSGGTQASLVTATITRHYLDIYPALFPLIGPQQDIATVVWEISTNRSNFGDAEIKFQYTDAEIGTLDEATLQIWQRLPNTMTWVPAPGAIPQTQRDRDRNEIRASTNFITGFGQFAIVGGALPPPPPSAAEVWAAYE